MAKLACLPNFRKYFIACRPVKSALEDSMQNNQIFCKLNSMVQTLFDKYGGVPAVTLIVRDFYKRVMKRPNLRRYFSDIPMETLILHQIAFVSMAMGKTPHNYAGRSMNQAHAGLGITAASFDLAVDLLRDALLEANIETHDANTIIATGNKLKIDIVGR